MVLVENETKKPGICKIPSFFPNFQKEIEQLISWRKAPKRRRWREERGAFEEVSRLAGTNSERESDDTTVSNCHVRTKKKETAKAVSFR